jgi:hypothetical protein
VVARRVASGGSAGGVSRARGSARSKIAVSVASFEGDTHCWRLPDRSQTTDTCTALSDALVAIASSSTEPHEPVHSRQALSQWRAGITKGRAREYETEATQRRRGPGPLEEPCSGPARRPSLPQVPPGG